jgi:hypothetical protein
MKFKIGDILKIESTGVMVMVGEVVGMSKFSCGAPDNVLCYKIKVFFPYGAAWNVPVSKSFYKQFITKTVHKLSNEEYLQYVMEL